MYLNVAIASKMARRETLVWISVAPLFFVVDPFGFGVVVVVPP